MIIRHVYNHDNMCYLTWDDVQSLFLDNINSDTMYMKQVRLWMLTNLKIICQFHAHPLHQNIANIFWAEIYIGDNFFMPPRRRVAGAY